jgi:hypothetical protein
VLQLPIDNNGAPIYKRGYSGDEFSLLAAIRQTYSPVVATLPDIDAATTITLDATTITATYRDYPVFPSDYPSITDPINVKSYSYPYMQGWLIPGEWVSVGASTTNIRESIFPTSLDSPVSPPNAFRAIDSSRYILPSLYTKTYGQMIDEAIAAAPAPTLTVPVTLSKQCA